jgi:hypothetical protein
VLTKTFVLPFVLAATVFAASPGTAKSSAIGIVTASGHFTLDRSEVWGNTTLFNGARIETRDASSEAVLRNGVRIQLGAASAANVLENRVSLLKGVGQISGANNYEVDAGGFSIQPASRDSRVRVGWAADGKLEVASLAGSARVMNGAGFLLASLSAGKSMSFAMQVAGAVTRIGCLLYKDGRYLIQDQNTQQVLEVTGPNLASNVGNRVNATGTLSSARPALTIATGVLNATSVRLQEPGGCLSIAAALDAQTEVTGAEAAAAQAPGAPAAGPAAAPAPSPAPAPKKGMSTGAKVAIVGVVAGGGAGAAIALAGGKKSTSQ